MKRGKVKKLIAVAAATVAVVGGLVMVPSAQAAPPQSAADYTPPPVGWGACEHPRLVDAGAECGFVEVPLDYAKPRGTKIQLAVSRVKHKTPDAQAQGPMLVNPGGPGGSGLIYAIFGEFVPGGAGDSYDWVGFDPRGVGSSQPSLNCIPDYAGYNRPFYVPVTPQLERTWLNRSRDYARACDRNQHELLKHLKTVDSARDMDSIRKALGAPQINYYGFSYGTYLGQVYGTLFPDKFRRVIFDGNVNAQRIWYDANIDQDLAFDRNIKIYFDWVAEHDDSYHLGTTGAQVERLFYTEQARLLRAPAGGVIGPDEWADLFLQAAYYVYGWEDVAQAFSGWVHDGEVQPLIDLYGSPPFDDNGYAIYLAVQCTDIQWPTDWDKWRRDNWRTFLRAPFATWGNAWFNAPCLYWGARAGTPVRIDGSRVRNALLINETLDSATPYEGALVTRRLFPNSVLIEGVGGTTHSGSLSGVACTDDRIAEYLRTGALPARVPGNRSDVQCPPVPRPDPSAAAQSRTAAATGTSVADLRQEFLKSFRR
ncbi:MAG TPA: alpha/beta fold hydrolase [Actinophytocola sp.]|uniref:alpha/beta fold hydrolase n=1 Tax=Actinophytocola sp. TaxID=1872138 RepID=UPI002DB91B6A|nr:alpha/beta fold hydrolase [Actinophytocola sp.]HEU5475152.1 alpha/beta fold hydrolase [Actinophytocola sp.]